MYSIEEIERIAAETENANPHVLHIYDIIRQLLAERSQIRRQAFLEAADVAYGYAHNEDNLFNGTVTAKWLGLRIGATLRRKAEEGK